MVNEVRLQGTAAANRCRSDEQAPPSPSVTPALLPTLVETLNCRNDRAQKRIGRSHA
jgi:hypothetical protein